MSQTRKVIHVELKEPYKGRRNYYFGSAAAIYDTLPVEIVGIAAGALWNVFGKEQKYVGRLAIIREGRLLSKKTNRGKKGGNNG